MAYWFFSCWNCRPFRRIFLLCKQMEIQSGQQKADEQKFLSANHFPMMYLKPSDQRPSEGVRKFPGGKRE